MLLDDAYLHMGDYWKEGQTSTYYCHNFPGGEAGTNLYRLVNRGTYVLTTCWRSLLGSVLTQGQTYNLKFGMLPLEYEATHWH